MIIIFSEFTEVLLKDTQNPGKFIKEVKRIKFQDNAVCSSYTSGAIITAFESLRNNVDRFPILYVMTTNKNLRSNATLLQEHRIRKHIQQFNPTINFIVGRREICDGTEQYVQTYRDYYVEPTYGQMYYVDEDSNFGEIIYSRMYSKFQTSSVVSAYYSRGSSASLRFNITKDDLSQIEITTLGSFLNFSLDCSFKMIVDFPHFKVLAIIKGQRCKLTFQSDRNVIVQVNSELQFPLQYGFCISRYCNTSLRLEPYKTWPNTFVVDLSHHPDYALKYITLNTLPSFFQNNSTSITQIQKMAPQVFATSKIDRYQEYQIALGFLDKKNRQVFDVLTHSYHSKIIGAKS